MTDCTDHAKEAIEGGKDAIEHFNSVCCANCRLIINGLFEKTAISHLTVGEAKERFPCLGYEKDT